MTLSNTFKRTTATAAIILAGLGMSALSVAGEGNYNSATKYEKTQGTIVDAAVATPDLSTLVAAVQAAGLVDTLSGEGPFTVFAPTNEAFAALPAGTADTLLLPENKDKLTRILTSHVIAGKLTASDVIAAAEANGGKAVVTTLSGAKLKAKVKNGAVYIKDESGNYSKVTTADVKTSNGVVHIVNSVLLPSTTADASAS